VRITVLVRAALALLCVAGIVVSVISYRSQRDFDAGFSRLLQGQRDDRTRELLESARTLNPDGQAEQGLANVALAQRREWRPLMRRALDREPEHAALHAIYSAFLGVEADRARAGGDSEHAAELSAESRRAYERASELDPQRFPPPPGGGG
jgi:hypothetical protein